MDINNINSLLKGQAIISEKDLSAALNLTQKTLREYRKKVDNPLKFTKIGRDTFYTKRHILEFFVGQMVGLSKNERKEILQNLESELES